MRAFCKNMPKIELHAHLNGSLSRATLKKLGVQQSKALQYEKLRSGAVIQESALNECFKLFAVAHKATNNARNVYLATLSVIKEFQKDNVVYLELRTTPRTGPNMSKTAYMEAVVKAVNKFKNRGIIVKLLFSIDRRHDLHVSLEALDLIIQMKNKYPCIIKGLDLCGDPSTGSFYKEVFEKAKGNGLKVTLHCGEVKNDKEVGKMLRFGPHRLGHATFLHPNHGGSKKNWKLYLKKQIPVECCMTSNVICKTSKDYRSHHVREWFAKKLPFVLCTDDKGVFRTNLSKEMYAASKLGFTKLDLWSVGYNAIDFTFASQFEKDQLRKFFQCFLDAELNNYSLFIQSLAM